MLWFVIIEHAVALAIVGAYVAVHRHRVKAPPEGGGADGPTMTGT
jgi:hypothetical protein